MTDSAMMAALLVLPFLFNAVVQVRLTWRVVA
jgi:hypothetical protein